MEMDFLIVTFWVFSTAVDTDNKGKHLVFCNFFAIFGSKQK